MKRKLLSLLVLLMTAVTGVWAQRLYLEVNGTAATLKYSANEVDYSDKPYFTGTSWQNANGFKSSVKTITVDASCENFAGDKLEDLFSGCSELTSITGLGTINTTNVTTMRNMFQNCAGLQTLDLSGFNTSSVTKMSNMFYGCSGLTTLTFGSSFNTSSVTDMSYMFYYCSGLGTLDLSSFNTSSVTTMSNMFRACTGLQTLDISSFNTGNVTNMGSMFNGCSQLTAIFVGAGWSVASSATSMFTNCTNLPNWDKTSTNGTHANTDADGYLNKVNVIANSAEGAKWATFYNEKYSFEADANTQVFKVELDGKKLKMHEIEDKIVNAYLPVVLKTTGSGNPLMTVTTKATSNTEPTSLSGWAGPGNLAADGNMYVLNYTTNGVGFYKLADGSVLTPGKAFLYYTETLARGFFGFDETTSIESMSVNENFENGEVYDLQGRRVSQPTKGLYIVNGKKVVIK